MKKIIRAIMLLGIIVFVSCSSDSSEKIIECKLLKYGGFIYENKSFYTNELIYENNKIVKRLNFGNNIPSSTGYIGFGLISTNYVSYDSNNRVEKIDYSNATYTRCDLFYYEGNSTNPYKRENIEIYNDDGSTKKQTETITYDNQNRILKTYIFFERDPRFNITTDYIYNSEGNLITVTIEEKIFSSIVYSKTKIVAYSDYDINKNPFANINVPFIENRALKYSKNNHKKVEVIDIDYGGGTSYSSHWISDYAYNEYGYPLFGEYLCN